MTYNVLASGSSGNAVIINRNILVDCGVPFKTIDPYAKDLQLVLLTHAHGDHFKPSTVRALHKRHPALRWGCREWMVMPLLEAGTDKRTIHVMEASTNLGTANHYWYSDSGFCVRPFQLLHNVSNCGWSIHFFEKGERLFYATDCATLDGIDAKNYDLYMIEANHTQEEIDARIAAKLAAGEYPYELEARRNHLSQEQALDWLAENAGPNSRYVWLHQHRERRKEET